MPKKTREKLRKIILIPVATKVIKETEDAGIVEHFFSVMGNIDHDRDRIMPGAFAKTLSDHGVGNIRVLDSHNFQSATDALGSPIKIEQVGRDQLPAEIQERFPDAVAAMRAETRFNLKTSKGHDTFHLLKAGDLKEWSFGFAIVKSDFETVKAKNDRLGWTLADDGDEIRIQNLRELELFEYSPVIWGANSATSTVGAKSADQGIDGELHKRLVAKYEERQPEDKSTDLRALIRALSIAFYNQFPDTEQNVYWVIEVWDTHLIVLDEGEHGEKHWRVNYHLDQDQMPVFAHADEWAEVEQVWVDKGRAKTPDITVKLELDEPLQELIDAAETLPDLDQPIGAALQQSVMAVATTQLDDWHKSGLITPDQFVVLSASVGKTMGTMAISIPESVKALQVPASLVIASKNGVVITTQQVSKGQQTETKEEETQAKDNGKDRAEPSETTLTLDGDKALERIRELKQNQK